VLRLTKSKREKRTKALELPGNVASNGQVVVDLGIAQQSVGVLLGKAIKNSIEPEIKGAPKKKRKKSESKLHRLPKQSILDAVDEGLTAEEVCNRFEISRYLLNRLVDERQNERQNAVWKERPLDCHSKQAIFAAINQGYSANELSDRFRIPLDQLIQLVMERGKTKGYLSDHKCLRRKRYHEMVASYRPGMSLNEIRQAFKAAVRKFLDAHIPYRPDTRRELTPEAQERNRTIRDLRNNGLSLQKIGDRFGITKERVRQTLLGPIRKRR